ncbi:MAG: DUF1962 domain-containing protein [Labilithrix sp.]|nr:DUF1962 domain-containing protein [Labilithrix sp.]MBX3220351.1 DUF1962 domain-containing protein [Labilithrix sp.]
MRRVLVVIVALGIGGGAQACEARARTAPAQPAPPPPYAGPPPGAQCADGPATCGADRASVVQCQRGAWVLLQACPGSLGCSLAGGAIRCDSSPSQAGAPCEPEGGYGCTPDRRNLTVCRAGRTAIASTCRGVRGCSIGNAIDCDHSVALVGDPCDGPKEIACSQDSKALLRCSNGVYQIGEACRNACLASSGRVLCQ